MEKIRRERYCYSGRICYNNSLKTMIFAFGAACVFGDENIMKINKKFWLRLLIVILVLILLLGVAGVAAVEYVLRKIGSASSGETFATIPPHLEDFETDEPEDPPDPVPDETTGSETLPDGTVPEETTPPTTAPEIEWGKVEPLHDDNIFNILLIGQDARVAGERARSDSMILLSINKKTNTINLTSFMRDLYVQIPGGYSDNRINASYRFGGAPLLDSTIRENFGVTVDGNVEVGFEQFTKIVDILGGVDVTLTAKEAAYLQNCGYSSIQEGLNHLNGQQALTFCRIRKIDSDHNRTERQRRVLISIANAAKSMSVGQMVEIINQVLPYVRTDLSDSQIISCATSGLTILAGGGSIVSGKVPQTGHYYSATIRGMAVLVPDLYQCNQYLKSLIYGG